MPTVERGLRRGGFSLDGDGGRQAVDLVEVRLLHHLQELPGIGREALHVAALALGINSVEGERRLAGAGEAGEHHEPVARDLDVDILRLCSRAPRMAITRVSGTLGSRAPVSRRRPARALSTQVGHRVSGSLAIAGR